MAFVCGCDGFRGPGTPGRTWSGRCLLRPGAPSRNQARQTPSGQRAGPPGERRRHGGHGALTGSQGPEKVSGWQQTWQGCVTCPTAGHSRDPSPDSWKKTSFPPPPACTPWSPCGRQDPRWGCCWPQTGLRLHGGQRRQSTPSPASLLPLLLRLATCCPHPSPLPAALPTAAATQHPHPSPGPPGWGQAPARERAAGRAACSASRSASASFISVSSFLLSLSRAASRPALLRPPARATCPPSSPPTRGAGCTPRSTIARRPPQPPTARATQ